MKQRKLNKSKVIAVFFSIIIVIIILSFIKTDLKLNKFSNNGNVMNSSEFKNGVKIDLLGYEIPMSSDSTLSVNNVFDDKTQLVIGEITNANNREIICNFNISIENEFIRNYTTSVNSSSVLAFKIPLEIPYGESQIKFDYFCD